jgi:von Willebrand factor type A domain
VDENNKDKLTSVPPTEGTSLATRRKFGISSLHQRVAAQPLPAVPTPLQQAVTQSVPGQNPLDALLEMANRLGLMLDCSSSMCEGAERGLSYTTKTKMEHLKDACQGFLQACDFSNTAIVIETFPANDEQEWDEDKDWNDSRYGPQDPLAHLLPGVPKAPKHKGKRGLCNIEAFLRAEIDLLKACGGTPMAGAMNRCITQNSLTRGIIVSDGGADSAAAAVAYAHYWREADIPIDCVHIGRSTSGEDLLKEIAKITGGMYIKFDNVANFAKNFKYLSPTHRAMLTAGSIAALGAKEMQR